MAAAARALATRADRSLIDDPFAEPLVRVGGIDLLTGLASGEMPPGELVGQTFIDVACELDQPQVTGRQVTVAAQAMRSWLWVGLVTTGTVWNSRPARSPISAPSRPRTGEWSRSISVRIGPPHCAQPDSTRDCRPRGVPKASWATYRPRRRTVCWTPSPNSARRAAGWPPKAGSTRDRATRRNEGTTEQHLRKPARAQFQHRHDEAPLFRCAQRSGALPGRPWLGADDDLRMGDVRYVSGTLDQTPA